MSSVSSSLDASAQDYSEAYELFRDAWGIPHLRAGDGLALARPGPYHRPRPCLAARGRTAPRAGHRGRLPRRRRPLSWDRFARRARLDDTARRCFDAGETGPGDRRLGAGVRRRRERGAGRGARRRRSSPAPASPPGAWEPWTPLGVWLATHILFAGFPAKLWRRTWRYGTSARTRSACSPPTARAPPAATAGWSPATAPPPAHADPRRRPAPLHRGPRRLPADPSVLPRVRRRRPRRPRRPRHRPLRPHRHGRLGDHQRHGRLPGPVPERLRRTATGVEALGPDGGWRPRHPAHRDGGGGGRGPGRGRGDRDRAGAGDRGGSGRAGRGARGAAGLPGYARGPPSATRPGSPGTSASAPCSLCSGPARRRRGPGVRPVGRARQRRPGRRHRGRAAAPGRRKGPACARTANRLRPVPAWEPGHDWQGWHDCPRAGLTDGIAVMANQRGPAAPLGVEFAPPHRADRIRALLRARSWSAADMAAIHMDTHLASAAAPAGPSSGALDGLSPEAVTHCGKRCSAGTAAWPRAAREAAALRRRAQRGRTTARRPPRVRGPGRPRPPTRTSSLPWLACSPGSPSRSNTCCDAEELYGIDRAGDGRAAVEEVAARAAAGHLGRNPSPRPLAGASRPDGAAAAALVAATTTACCAPPRVPGLTDLAARGPAARYVWDLARREDSLWVVPLGASGVPGSPHHRDQLPLWLKGDLVPVVTDWQHLTKED